MEAGYQVHTNIGCSGYKIDIGIVDKDTPSRYILGILCDGENYRNTKTARDREIVQNRVLQLLGWNICRVWTLDWFDNPDRVLKTIQQAVEDALIQEQLKNQRKAFRIVEEVTVEPEEIQQPEEEVIIETEQSDKVRPYTPPYYLKPITLPLLFIRKRPRNLFLYG